MSSTQVFEPGNYRYIPGVFQYSAGVAAEPGYRIERVRFAAPLPIAEGFRRAEGILQDAGRPLTAMCACELRSPAPFTEAGFGAFNEEYVALLTRFGIVGSGGPNPVARSNICPAVAPPATPSLYAFSYTVKDAGAAPSFVVAGSAEAPEGKGNYKDHIVHRGDVSPPALAEKAVWVLGEMERRMRALGFGWANATATQLYTVHDVHSFMAQEIVRRGATAGGLTWHFVRPPVVDLEYEMDCRAVHLERVLPA